MTAVAIYAEEPMAGRVNELETTGKRSPPADLRQIVVGSLGHVVDTLHHSVECR